MTFAWNRKNNAKNSIAPASRTTDMKAISSALAPGRRVARLRINQTLALTTWIWTAACAGAPSGRTKSAGHTEALIVQGATNEECQALKATEPQLEPVEAAKVPVSTLNLHSRIPLARIHKRIASQIPQVLASERDRPVGAPGRATFKVRRGSPSLEQNGERLVLQVPISAEISVCKPLGSGCFTYGSCSPQLEATFSVSNHLGPHYFLAPPQGSIRATKRCIIGIDVTSQIETIAKAEVRKVESQIRAQWPDLKAVAHEVWNNFSDPLPLVDDACFYFAPEDLRYVPPQIKTASGAGDEKQDPQALHAALQLKGIVSSAPSCNTPMKVPQLSDPTAARSLPNKSTVWVPELLSLESVKETLLAQIPGPLEGGGGRLELLDVRLGRKRVALHVRATGNLCGEIWFSARLAHVKGSSDLLLEDWVIVRDEVTKDEGGSPAEIQLLELVQKRSSIRLRSAGWFSEDQADRLRSELALNLPRGLGFELKNLRANNARVLGTSEGIMLLHPLSTQLLINDF